jgi:polyhydroxyalkanoate synthase
LKNVLPDWNLPPQSRERLAELSQRHPELAPYLAREMARRARLFMRGVALYRNHRVRRGDETAPIIWQSGTTRVRDYAPASPLAPVVLVVPSLINRFTILDLQPKHSFLRTLATHGYRPLVVDWDVPGEQEKNFCLDDYIRQRLLPALHIAAAERPAHVVGYCMGGVLALALAVLSPERVRGLSLLATPWDFHAGYEALGRDGTELEEKLAPWLATEDLLPTEVVQSIFTAFQPLHAYQKFSSFTTRNQSSSEAARFVLTEDWLNDGVPLPANVGRECFADWGRRNKLAKGEWKLADKSIDPRNVKAPTYLVVPTRDRIVPPESAMALAATIADATYIQPEMGHIALMSSSQAPTQIWLPLIEWMARR